MDRIAHIPRDRFCIPVWRAMMEWEARYGVLAGQNVPNEDYEDGQESDVAYAKARHGWLRFWTASNADKEQSFQSAIAWEKSEDDDGDGSNSVRKTVP
jgi:hypothetical protein